MPMVVAFFSLKGWEFSAWGIAPGAERDRAACFA